MKALALTAGAPNCRVLRRQTADFAGHRAKYGLPVVRKIPGPIILRSGPYAAGLRGGSAVDQA